MTALDTPQGDLAYVYNLAGQVTQMTADASDVTTYAYDAYGRFSSLTNPFSETTSVAYDASGRVSRKDFDSGVYETFAYDDRSRPTLILVKNSSNAEIDRKEYVWDDASRVTSAKEGGYWSYYEYDEVDQLIEEEKPGLSYLATYTYDDNGNRLTRTVNSVTETYAYDEADKLLDVTVNSSVVKEYTYDAAGRTTAIETGSGTTSFAYDYEGRITGITYPNTSTDSFGYNGLGARTSTSGTNGSRTFFRNGLGVTSPVLSDGTADYTPGVSRTQSTTTTFAHAGLKNTSTQSAENETVAATKVYDAFGNSVSSSGSWSGPFQYAGNFGYQQDPNGLKLLGHRYYDSSTGSFLTMDLAGEGANWTTYVANSPVSACDAEGLMRTDIAQGAVLTAEEATMWETVWANVPNWIKAIVNFGSKNPSAVSRVSAAAASIASRGSVVVRRGLLPRLARLPGETPQQAGVRLHGLLKGAESATLRVNRALPSGLRPDIVDWRNRVIVEVKPDSWYQIQRGMRQIQKYLEEVERLTGEKWRGEIWTYETFGGGLRSMPLTLGGAH